MLATDKLSFNRVTDNNCISYNIFKIINNEEILIENLENPTVPNPVEKTVIIKYNEKQEWDLPKNTIASCSYGVKVFIDGEELTTSYYTFSPSLKVLIILKKLQETNVIELKLFVDEIQIEYETDEDRDYKVVPVFSNNFNLGRHIKL